MGFVSGFVDEIVSPMETAAGQLRQLSKAHTDANAYLQSQAQALTPVFGGKGANTFFTMVQRQGQFITGITTELNDTAGIFEQAARVIRDAAQVADWALGGPLLELGERVLARLSPPIVVQHGESAVTAITNDMRKTFHDLLHQGGGFFSDLAHGDIGGALHAAENALGDLAHLASDIFALLDQVETILGQWAAKVMEGANWLTNQFQSILFRVEDFVFGFSQIDDNAAILADPNSTPLEKGIAMASIGLTVVTDVLLLIPGAEEGGVALDAAEKTIVDEAENEIEQQVEKEVESEVEQQVEKEVESEVEQQVEKELSTNEEPPIDNGNGDGDPAKVYRVQGGDSQERLLVTPDGNLEIQGNNMLFLNFNQEGRAFEFLARRGESAYIVRFEVDNEFLQFLRSTAVDEREARLFPDMPIKVDTRFPDQFGIRSNLFDELLEYMIPGSAEIIRP